MEVQDEASNNSEGIVVCGNKESEKIDQQALAVIGLSVRDEQIVHIDGAKTSKEAWNSSRNLQKLHYSEKNASSRAVDEDKDELRNFH